jgi:uncharacterized membrane protein YuzA (DUF378 family)
LIPIGCIIIGIKVDISSFQIHMKALHTTAFILLIVGGLNWLLVGIFGWDVGSIFGGQDAVISKIVYILVGLSAIYEIVTHKKNCKNCVESSMSAPTASM